MSNLKRTLIHGLEHGLMCQLTQADFPKSLYMKTHGKNIIEPLVGFKHDKFYVGGNRVDVDTWEFKPYLFPLSSLTKEIEHKGERFVPIGQIYKKYKYTISEKTIELILDNGDLFICPYGIIEWLIEHHFNVFDLSPDEFIEVTEENNPYAV